MSEDNSDDDSSKKSTFSKEKTEVEGGKKEKGFTGDGDAGAEGGYGFISPAAESDDTGDSESDSE